MVLHYRIPGHELVTCHGQFHPIPMDETPRGFIVSNADGEKRFVFKTNPARPFVVQSQNPPHQAKKSEYIMAVDRITEGIHNSKLKKVVYSRVIKRALKQSKRFSYFERLMQTYPQAFVYYFEDENLGSWVGATPEILLRRIESHCFVMSLAGTKKANEHRAWTEKEEIEQTLVTDFILEGINGLSLGEVEVDGPYAHQAGPVEHLRTDITFNIDSQREMQLIQQLHPTPAVCGLPRNMAKQAYEAMEIHRRELYTGYIGVFDEQQTHCYVNLRCAKLIDDELFAYVGGGITDESVPELEWIETENKSKTLFDLLEIS
jgi:isochorismate synthase